MKYSNMVRHKSPNECRRPASRHNRSSCGHRTPCLFLTLVKHLGFRSGSGHRPHRTLKLYETRPWNPKHPFLKQSFDSLDPTPYNIPKHATNTLLHTCQKCLQKALICVTNPKFRWQNTHGEFIFECFKTFCACEKRKQVLEKRFKRGRDSSVPEVIVCYSLR